MAPDRRLPRNPLLAREVHFAGRKEFRVASSRKSWKPWVIGAVALVLLAGLIAFQFRGAGSANAASPKVVNIAGIAYPFEGRQVYSGVTGVVIEQGWLKDELAKR